MSETDDIDEQIGKPKGGARIIMRDPRLSSAIEFLKPILSGFIVGAVIYLGTQFGALRDAVIETNKQMALSTQQNTRMVEDLRDHEGRLRTLEGRNIRGHREPMVLPSESARGN